MTGHVCGNVYMGRVAIHIRARLNRPVPLHASLGSYPGALIQAEISLDIFIQSKVPRHVGSARLRELPKRSRLIKYSG